MDQENKVDSADAHARSHAHKIIIHFKWMDEPVTLYYESTLWGATPGYTMFQGVRIPAVSGGFPGPRDTPPDIFWVSRPRDTRKCITGGLSWAPRYLWYPGGVSRPRDTAGIRGVVSRGPDTRSYPGVVSRLWDTRVSRGGCILTPGYPAVSKGGIRAAVYSGVSKGVVSRPPDIPGI